MLGTPELCALAASCRSFSCAWPRIRMLRASIYSNYIADDLDQPPSSIEFPIVRRISFRGVPPLASLRTPSSAHVLSLNLVTAQSNLNPFGLPSPLQAHCTSTRRCHSDLLSKSDPFASIISTKFRVSCFQNTYLAFFSR